MRRGEKRGEGDRHANYKNLISQYYERDAQLSDVRTEVRAVTPEIEILEELNDFERKIDTLIKTKRYDVQELYMKPPQKLKRLLRVKLLREGQPGQQLLKLYGYIYPRREETAACKLTSFFRQLTLVSDRDKALLENWKKPTTNFVERDGLAIKLPTNADDALSLYLTPIANPPRFQVDPALERIVGLRTGTRVEVLDAFWLYVKSRKLQDVENKEIINSDELIRQAFKAEKLTFATVNHRVRELLSPVEPLRLQLGAGENEKVFDIPVEVEEKPAVDIVPFFSQKLNEEKNDHPFLSLVGRIKKYEGKFRDHAEKLRRHLAKRHLYQNFSTQALEKLLEEQAKLVAELQRAEPVDDYGRLEYVLENEDELQKEVKHYFEQLSAARAE